MTDSQDNPRTGGLGSPATAKSPIMYPGGKQRMLPSIRPLRPAGFERYHEVCAGGLAHFLDLRSSGYAGPAYIYDANEELIRTYRAILTDPVAVAAAYRRHGEVHSEAHYLLVRRTNWVSLADADIAGRMLYLNRTCYNALYRVNRRGGFSVGMGHDRSAGLRHRLDVDNLRAVSLALRGAELLAADFTAVLARARGGDFVFIDPPYPNGFTGYTAAGFTDGDQRRLREVCGELDRMGVMFMQTNADCGLIRGLYRGFRLHEVEARRMIGNAWGSRVARELIIVNYGRSGRTIPNGIGSRHACPQDGGSPARRKPAGGRGGGRGRGATA